MPNTRHLYKVFVSSTYLDNKERRKLVQDAITTAGMVWHRQRQCPDHRPGPVPRYNRGQISPARRLLVGREARKLSPGSQIIVESAK